MCCLLAAAYSAAVPAFEAPDEPGHYAYVEWLLGGRGVPLQGQEPLPLQPEFSQPPLYYLVETPAAWLAGRQPANLPDWERQRNPFQNATDFGNVNLYLHSPAEAFPWTGAALGLHLMRLLNLVFAAVTVLATYGCAREVGMSRLPSWCAAALVGLVPQFTFSAGVLNADNAVASLSALSLYLLLRWLNRPPSLAGAAWLGLALGGAALSKLSGLIAVGVALGFMGLRWIWLARNAQPAIVTVAAAAPGAPARSRWRSSKTRAPASLALTAVTAALIAGWWYVRNWLWLGDPLGWSAMLAATGDMLRRRPLSLIAAAFDLLERGYTGFAVFGWANLEVHWLWYWLSLVAAGWGIAGLLLLAWTVGRKRPAAKEHPRGLHAVLLVVWALAFMASLARWVEVNTAADQWRLLFPAYPALLILLVLGWQQVVRGGEQLLIGIPAGLLALNAGALALVVVPAYRGPAVYSGQVQHSLDLRFGSALDLVGYNTARPLDIKPGDAVEIDLLWRRTGPLPKDYAADVATVDAKGQLTWKEQTIPDEGRAPMSAWPMGATIVDRHRIRARSEMVGSQTLLVSVLDPVPPGDHLPAAAADGRRLPNDTATLGHFVVLPASVAAPQAKDNVSFQDHLQLVGHTVVQDRELLRVTLTWKAAAPASKDYTVFVHLVAADGKQVAQSDGQPGGGAFPTSLLDGGVEVPDVHILDVTQAPPGDYRLEVGLYDLGSGARLATRTGESNLSFPVRIR